MSSPQKRCFRALLSVLFLDSLGLAIVYPIFAPLVLSSNHSLLTSTDSPTLRLFLLGLLIASFPFTQFLAAPFIGHLADAKGRKFTFTLALIGEAMGFCFTGLAILHMNYLLLLLSRAFTGFFAGNIIVCLSALADMNTDPKKRSTQFGVVSTVLGISFVITIALGGLLSNRMVSSTFSAPLPFWVLAIYSMINLGIIRCRFTETLQNQSNNQNKLSLRCQLQAILTLFKTKQLTALYFLFFFFMLGWITSLQFLSSFLFHYFTHDKLTITLTLIGMGIGWCLGTIVVNPFLIRRIQIKNLLLSSLILSCTTLSIASVVSSIVAFIHVVVLGGLFASLAWINSLALISIKAPSHFQGKLLGINQSIATIVMVLAPLLGVMIGAIDIRMTYLFASGSLLASIISLIVYNVKNRF